MFEKLLRIFGGRRDALVFQITEEFIEITALRQDKEAAKHLGDACITETLYTKRVPIHKPSDKKVLDELATQVQALADAAVSSPELIAHNFSLKSAKVVCVLVEPLSHKATTVYAAESAKPLKITTKLLSSILVDERVVESTLHDAPKGHAVYADELVEVELNGYNTTKPLGRYAKEVKLKVEKYLIDPKLWSAVGIILEKVFNREIRYLHSSEVVDVSTNMFCNEIYTATELQTVSNDIL